MILVDQVLNDLDLSGKDFSRCVFLRCSFYRATLVETCFHEAEIEGCSFIDANLQKADFRAAHILTSRFDGARCDEIAWVEAELFECRLVRTSLSEAMLQAASFNKCSLRQADLRETDLSYARFCSVDFDDANVQGAVLEETSFINCGSIHLAANLESVQHYGPSSLDLATLRPSVCELSESFLTEVGLSRHEVETLSSLYSRALEFYSCFLSHAGQDREFAEKLRSRLIAHHVSCWHYSFDMQGGKPWRSQIHSAIKVHDKLVLVCSEYSVLRQNVVDEVIAAMERERESGSQKLFPIRVDDFILSEEMLCVTDAQVSAGKWREDWVRYVRSYHIPDFSDWRDENRFSQQFSRFLRDLRNPDPR